MSEVIILTIFRQKIVDFLDLTLLKDVVYVNIVFGLTCTHISDQYFYVLMPKYLEELNISKVTIRANLANLFIYIFRSDVVISFFHIL